MDWTKIEIGEVFVREGVTFELTEKYTDDDGNVIGVAYQEIPQQ